MFFGQGRADCFDCTTINGEWVCTMNCGPKVMPQGAGEKGRTMTDPWGGNLLDKIPHGRAGTAGATVRPRTTPRGKRAGAVSRQLKER